ncbi:MAG TPA: signal peptidase II, partial [Microbacterium sp.]|nr:signal peptidase II [Microbacterium sp.]
MTGRAPLHKAAAGTIIAILAVVVLAADQFTKYLAIENLPPQESVEVLGEFLQFYLVRNPGAAFSLGEGVTWIFTIALAVVAGVIVWLAATRIRSRLWAVVLGLLLGGVL